MPKPPYAYQQSIRGSKSAHQKKESDAIHVNSVNDQSETLQRFLKRSDIDPQRDRKRAELCETFGQFSDSEKKTKRRFLEELVKKLSKLAKQQMKMVKSELRSDARGFLREAKGPSLNEAVIPNVAIAAIAFLLAIEKFGKRQKGN